MTYCIESELLSELPLGWTHRRLKEVADVIPSNVDKHTVEGQEPARLCNYVDTYKNEKITASIEFMAASASQAQIERLSLRKGDITITKDSESPWDIAVPAYIAEDIDGLVCGYHLSRISPNTQLMDGNFLSWALRSKPVNVQFALSAQGITRYGLSSSALADGVVPCPPLNEQRAIASYLDAETARIDGLIEAKGELLALLRGLDLTAFFSALAAKADGKPGRTDDQVRWLANLPFSWERCKVKHLVLSFDQGVSPQCEGRVPDEGEWGVLKVGCVNSGQFDPLESKALPPEIAPVPEVTVEEGDLLVSRANTKALVGRSAVAARSFPRLLLSDKLYRLKLDRKRCLPDFVRRLMWIPAVRQMIEERATGASPSMLNIDRRTILELPIPLPPVDEQEQILREAKKANSAAQDLIRHVESEIDLLREMRSATITDAVLGRIDVREHMKH